MSFASFISKLRLSPRDAEVIFDRTEPVGEPSDLVLPSRRWFRRQANVNAVKLNRSTHAQREQRRAGSAS